MQVRKKRIVEIIIPTIFFFFHFSALVHFLYHNRLLFRLWIWWCGIISLLRSSLYSNSIFSLYKVKVFIIVFRYTDSKGVAFLQNIHNELLVLINEPFFQGQATMRWSCCNLAKLILASSNYSFLLSSLPLLIFQYGNKGCGVFKWGVQN